MQRTFKIRIKRRTQANWLVWFIILLPLLFGVINDLIGFPREIRYAIDATWLILLAMLVRSRRAIRMKATRGLTLWTVLFFVYTLLVYLVVFQSPLYFLWGVRNNFRFYVAFFAAAAFLVRDDAYSFYNLLDGLFWINIGISLVQYFALGYKGDQLGGIFGVITGVNGYSNAFFAVILAKTFVFYLEKQESLSKVIAQCVTAVVVAALAEIKFFFIELLLIIILAVLFTNFTWRKLWVVLGGLSTVAVGVVLLTVVFENSEDWFTTNWLLRYASSDKGYTSSGDLNRLNAIPQINMLWLKSWGQQLFGMGLGNCDTASFEIVNTPFFKNYGDMHYTWFSYAMMYLETGYIGLLFYFVFFILVFLEIRRLEKNCDSAILPYCRIGRIIAVCCIPIAVYNASLRAEGGYMLYFAMAMPFALAKEKKL